MFCVTDSYAVFCLKTVSFVMQEVTNDDAKGYGWYCEKQRMTRRTAHNGMVICHVCSAIWPVFVCKTAKNVVQMVDYGQNRHNRKGKKQKTRAFFFLPYGQFFICYGVFYKCPYCYK